MLKPRVVAVLSLMLVTVIAGAALRAQAPPRSDGPALDALLAEVKALRADFNQVARISLGSQLAAVRLQLQEQRIASVAGQLADLRKRIDDRLSERTNWQTQMKQTEDALRTVPVGDLQQQMEQHLSFLKQNITRLGGEEQSLRLQETELASQMASDQAVWIQINSRLGELEGQLQGTLK
jgi:chromosome segregation ATPase